MSGSLLRPDMTAERVVDIDPLSLWKLGARGLLIDADNTLTPFGEMYLPDGYREWLDKCLATGFRIVIFTNNFKERATAIEALTGLPVVYGWVKPWPWGMARAAKRLDIPKDRIMLVGDQLFTDILGARLYGMKCVLVEPLAKKDHLWTGLMRKLERLAGRGRR